MRLLFKSVFLSTAVFLSLCVSGEEVLSTYDVSTKGIKIGELVWSLQKENDTYKIKIKLKNKGLLSVIYKFNGEYFSVGKIKDGLFISQNYSHKWLTKKKNKEMNVTFHNGGVSSLSQKPAETEFARINLSDLVGFSDPLTSFINILNNNPSSDTIDGRRVYKMQVVENLGGVEDKTILIKNYKNIWADHKRNDLEKIIFTKQQNFMLPESLEIYFKGSVFKLYKT